MYKLRETIRRGSAFVAAGALLGSSLAMALPAVTTFADALNPLTERSLTLSSSSPGYHYLDGSGNPTYAPPGSGNNGQKTGETYTFRVTTDSTTSPAIKAFTFQYCTTPAGDCTTPGNVGSGNPAGESNLSIHYDTAAAEGTDFEVYVNNVASSGWSVSDSRVIDHAVPTDTSATDKNFITLSNSTGIHPATHDQIKVVFFASNVNYITNPGTGAFFVKVNDYDSALDTDHIPTTTSHIVDGGVTVANVMNDSIWIQTKVLETMNFSVGTTNPDTVVNPSGGHGTCDAVAVNDPIQMGNPTAEYSLAVAQAYDATSYWRLSSNSSGGATVYYSGNTLSNTEGDQIDAIGTTAVSSHPGTEQFGLAMDSTADTVDTAHAPTAGFQSNLIDTLFALTGSPTDYSQGAGTITNGGTAKFAFDANSLTSPVAIASENTDIVHCTTGKMRYVANIAPDTPAGVYTSKINYIASPEY